MKVREICCGVDAIVQLLETEFEAATSASAATRASVADRVAAEVERICTESQRIQASGEVDRWRQILARHRLQQCLRYYQLGSRSGRVELHSTLSAIIYRYIAPARSRASYQARLQAIEDFLQDFYGESLKAFRRENQLPADYTPRRLLELAEYMAFTERYAKRRIPLPGGRSQQLAILRAQTFARQQPPETSVDIEQAAEGGSNDHEDYTWDDASVQQVREHMGAQDSNEVMEETLRRAVVDELIAYLQERKQDDCVNYFVLRLQDMSASEIETVLGLTARERDYLQQRFKYHLIRFALLHHWHLVHQWLDADLERDLGLTPHRWETLLRSLDPSQRTLLELKQAGKADPDIAAHLGLTTPQFQKRWFEILEKAWDLRNRPESGTGESTDE